MKKFSDVVIKTDAIDYVNNLGNKVLLIYSPTSANKINLFDKLKNKIRCISTHETNKEILLIEKYLNDNLNFEYVIGFGGGTALDIAKYIAYKHNLKMIAIPSMLSTNVYSTDKVLMSYDGIKNTMDSKLPDIIIYDEKILKLSLLENVYGFADVLSIFTATKDWQIAKENNNEIINEELYDMDVNLLNKIINYILYNDYIEIINQLYEMFIFIGTAGHIANLNGNGRPVSGSEHIFAKELEYRISIPHGISVSLGILIMSTYQENFSKEIEKCIEKLKIFEKIHKYNVSKDLIYDILKNLKPRDDRYSIVNIYDVNNHNTLENIEEILYKLNIS